MDTESATPDIVLDDLEVAAPATPKGGDELTLIIHGKEWSGWQRVQLMRSMETVPASFSVEGTDNPDIDIKPGDPCQVKLGGDLVLTGYIDRYSATVTPETHTVRITGRSKSQDLTDCAAFIGDKENPTYLASCTALSIAQALAKPYDVTVASMSGPGKTVPQFPLNLGETAWEVIDRLARVSALIAYDMPDGSLMLANAGTEKMASGFVQGENLESAAVNFSMDIRFREYEGFHLSTLALTTGDQGHIQRGVIAKDEAVPRFRKHIIISEQVDQDGYTLEKRVNWEKNRNIGRSTAATVVCDSWRDKSNNLWAPNHVAPIKIPLLKLPDASWTIGQVVYTRDENGTHAQVTLMPASAFEPEPSVFMPLPPTVQDMHPGSTGTPQTNPTARETFGAPDVGPAIPLNPPT
jgi:prophage tail gpP-like protein